MQKLSQSLAALDRQLKKGYIEDWEAASAAIRYTLADNDYTSLACIPESLSQVILAYLGDLISRGQPYVPFVIGVPFSLKDERYTVERLKALREWITSKREPKVHDPEDEPEPA